MEPTPHYWQVASLAVAALWNGIQAYEAYPKFWKVALSAVSAVFLAVMAWNQVWPIF